jgi:thiamine biosynthesis protein ThiI
MRELSQRQDARGPRLTNVRLVVLAVAVATVPVILVIERFVDREIDALALAIGSAVLSALVLLRLSGEISTKARPTRRAFVVQLVRNVKDALASEGIAGTVLRRHDRVVVETDDARAPALLARVFGVQSASRAERHPIASLDDVVRVGEAAFREAVRGKRFAVRARRVGDPALPFRSRDVEVALGARLRGLSAGGDLDQPEFTARIELYGGAAYVFAEVAPGPGGLPLRTGGRAVALVSGGFDSAVAAWQLQRRGVVLEHVFANLGGLTHRLGALRVMEVLARRWSYGARTRLHVVDFAAVTRDLQANTETRYWQVILKRLMLRAAEAVARETHAHAIVTGEAVGQVSSQTLVNLATISEATRLPILRPLVGMDKDEITAEAQRIGTYSISIIPDQDCCTLFTPKHPATRARVAAVEHAERQHGAMHRVLLTPRGRRLDQGKLRELASSESLLLLCGHYEGIDHRVVDHLVNAEISIGDYVLTNGAIAAVVFVDAVARLLPGVLGHEQSASDDSFSSGLLEAPQYTRPAEFLGWKVPEILLSGNHEEIVAWRKSEARRRTRENRPDLLDE